MVQSLLVPCLVLRREVGELVELTYFNFGTFS